MHSHDQACLATGWRVTRVQDAPSRPRKVYTMWDDAVVVAGPPLPAQRDLLVAALFGPALVSERR